jgi:putative transposase
LLTSTNGYYYSAKKNEDFSREITKQHGKHSFETKFRALLGDTSELAFGPGSCYQIDATVGDIYLVSSLDRNLIIGRPVIYLVLDVYSHLIVGFCVTLEGPSWPGGRLALANAFANKVEFCARYGIVIAEFEWPSHHLCESITADRGEFLSHNADNLARGLNIRVNNTAPFRPDWKGLVERHFRTIQEDKEVFQAGAVHKRRYGRGENYRLEALLTLNEFRTLMIYQILRYNQTHWIKGYNLDELAIARHVSPCPLDLWHFGIESRSGQLRTMDPDIVKLNLLPQGTARVTRSGIEFAQRRYTSELAVREQWHEKAGARHNWEVQVAYDPSSLSTIYLRLDDRRSIHPCYLHKSDTTFLNRDWYEIMYYDAELAKLKRANDDRQLQSFADRHAQMEAVVASAKEQKAASSAQVSNRQRLLTIPQARRQEKEKERAEESRPLGPGRALPPPPQDEPASSADAPTVRYVPAPSGLDQLSRIRDEEYTGGGMTDEP